MLEGFNARSQGAQGDGDEVRKKSDLIDTAVCSIRTIIALAGVIIGGAVAGLSGCGSARARTTERIERGVRKGEPVSACRDERKDEK